MRAVALDRELDAAPCPRACCFDSQFRVIRSSIVARCTRGSRNSRCRDSCRCRRRPTRDRTPGRGRWSAATAVPFRPPRPWSACGSSGPSRRPWLSSQLLRRGLGRLDHLRRAPPAAAPARSLSSLRRLACTRRRPACVMPPSADRGAAEADHHHVLGLGEPVRRTRPPARTPAAAISTTCASERRAHHRRQPLGVLRTSHEDRGDGIHRYRRPCRVLQRDDADAFDAAFLQPIRSRR